MVLLLQRWGTKTGVYYRMPGERSNELKTSSFSRRLTLVGASTTCNGDGTHAAPSSGDRASTTHDTSRVWLVAASTTSLHPAELLCESFLDEIQSVPNRPRVVFRNVQHSLRGKILNNSVNLLRYEVLQVQRCEIGDDTK